HFKVLDLWGWLNNLSHEPRRYVEWLNGRGVEFPTSLTLQHIFLLLTGVALIYLIIRAISSVKQSTATADNHLRLLITTLVVMFFFALITQRKVTQYIVHLSPWFGLCVGVMVADCIDMIRALKSSSLARGVLLYRSGLIFLSLLALVYTYQLTGRFFPSYLK